MVWGKTVLTLLLFCCLTACDTNKVETSQSSENAIYQGKLECKDSLSTEMYQKCWLKVFHKDKPVKNAEIFISGGMDSHNHRLPTSPKLTWSDDKEAYLIQGLKFSMHGTWTLNFKINAEDDAKKDQITMMVEVE